MVEGMAVDSLSPKRSPFKRPRRSPRRETNSSKDTPSCFNKGHRRTHTLPSLDTLVKESPSPAMLFRKPRVSFNPYSPEPVSQRAPESRGHRMLLSNSGSRYRTDFVELDKLGKGSFSQVFKCRHIIDDRLYAIKRLDRRSQQRMLSSSAKSVHEAALQEVHALSSQATHPHLVSYFDAWLEDGELFIQLEYCGDSLLTRVDPQNRVSESELLAVGFQLGQALKWLHSRGVVHRDVKPENAFEWPRGVFKLGDLGFAALEHDKADKLQNEDEEGDARYLCREVWASPQGCDWFKVDVFALGASLLELAQATRLPCAGAEWQSLREHGVDPRRLGLAQGLGQLICALIHSDPEHRPGAAQLCAHLQQDACLNQQLTHSTRVAELQQRARDVAEIERLQREQLNRYEMFARGCTDKVEPKIMMQLLEKAKKTVGNS